MSGRTAAGEARGACLWGAGDQQAAFDPHASQLASPRGLPSPLGRCAVHSMSSTAAGRLPPYRRPSSPRRRSCRPCPLHSCCTPALPLQHQPNCKALHAWVPHSMCIWGSRSSKQRAVHGAKQRKRRGRSRPAARTVGHSVSGGACIGEEFHELQRCTAACGRAMPRRGLGGTVHRAARQACGWRPKTRGGGELAANKHTRHAARGTRLGAAQPPARQLRWSASR